MNLLKMEIWRGSIFKQIRFLLSSPPRSQAGYLISEAGTASREILPMNTGWMCAEQSKKAWMVLHNLKFGVKKDGELMEGESVLLMSERLYTPLDPNGIMSEEDRAELTSLKDIARLRHAQRRSDTGNAPEKANLLNTIVTGSFIVIVIELVLHVVKTHIGG